MTDSFTQATISPFLPASLFTDEEIATMETTFGITCDKHNGFAYLFADTAFREWGEDEHGAELNLCELLQVKLRQLNADEYPCIAIQGCFSSGKMHMDEFGGFAHFITREEVRYVCTASWLDALKRDVTPISPEPILF